jgi:outer membrane scaffolding protein for murein synthesis (MipA/OmpV family)
MKRPALALFICTLVLLFSLFLGVPMVWPDETMDKIDMLEEMAEDIDEAPGFEDPKDRRRNWAVRLGIIGGVTPDYEGSNDYELSAGPMLSVTWKDFIWFRGKSLGANLINQGAWKAGPLATKSSGRDDDDNDKLEGLDDVDSSIEVGGFARYRKKPWRFDLRVRQDAGSGHEGAYIEVEAGARVPFDRPLFILSVESTWASDDYMQSYFGVTQKESDRSGLRKYDADAGFKNIGVKLATGIRFRTNWRIGGQIAYHRLIGDAEDSHIVDDENQLRAGIGLVYSWGSKELERELRRDEDW